MSGELWRDLPALALMGAGVLFFLAGSIGLLRLPDLLSRLHALTKADNLGLGLIVVGLALQTEDLSDLLQLALIWLLVLFASSAACVLVARAAIEAAAPRRAAAERADADPDAS